MHYVYILHSEKLERYYTVYTSNIDIRLGFHENAEAGKFTYNADDWKLVYSLLCDSKHQGMTIEKHIKSMKSKIYIQNLIQYPEMGIKLKLKFNP
ncbi:excinuclease ABC subunit C [Flavobacterium album]|uniref:Excinuclease ABC subunit C n=1 Tax=Flavobacterium album TaxID=2175091 RepID=A0A2S1QWI3_9FLAO|nr:GIY-YIG nuclease family protein [Flavobacterium album]AWH84591.1 excinuclease ABC subunit C [Flavobacterium album]